MFASFSIVILLHSLFSLSLKLIGKDNMSIPGSGLVRASHMNLKTCISTISSKV